MARSWMAAMGRALTRFDLDFPDLGTQLTAAEKQDLVAFLRAL
jgi:hypothetical protein